MGGGCKYWGFFFGKLFCFVFAYSLFFEHVGKMPYKLCCSSCKVYRAQGPGMGMCCYNGLVFIHTQKKSINMHPIFSKKDPKTKRFKKNPEKYLLCQPKWPLKLGKGFLAWATAHTTLLKSSHWREKHQVFSFTIPQTSMLPSCKWCITYTEGSI